MVVGWLSVLPLVFWGGIVGPLLPPGDTLAVQGAASAKTPWRAEVTPTRPGWLLLELDLEPRSGKRAVHPDLDLEVGLKGPDRAAVRLAASHRSRERLLIPISNPPGRLHLAVRSANQHAGAFRLRITQLASAGTLTAAAAARSTRGALTDTSRARLYELSTLTAARVALRLTPTQGEVDLLVFDRRGLPLALGERTTGPERATVDVAPGEAARVVVVARRAARYRLQVQNSPIALTPLETFLNGLARTPDQTRAVAALKKNPDFVRIRDYLEHYPGGVPLQLRVVPGLMAHGVERFGTYSQGTLTINPTILGHRTNPQELIDTLLHELVHAILALPRVDGFPLEVDVLDSSHDPVLKGSVGTPLRRGRLPKAQATYLDLNYGPSASNPDEDYTDINAGAQRLIVKVVRDNLRRSKVGQATLVFKNLTDRLERRHGAAAK